MSSFFRQLIDLGEEDKSKNVPAASSASDLNQMTKEDLVRRVQTLEISLREKQEVYDTLRTDSTKLQAEYDAYQRKVENWQRQMKEARENDRRAIEELRKAGSAGGSTDEALVKSMNETIGKYKEQLRAAQDDVTKAFRKQREAEDARRRAEEAKKIEIDELCGKFEAFKSHSLSTQKSLEGQLAEARKHSEDFSAFRSETLSLRSRVAELQAQLASENTAPQGEDKSGANNNGSSSPRHQKKSQRSSRRRSAAENAAMGEDLVDSAYKESHDSEDNDDIEQEEGQQQDGVNKKDEHLQEERNTTSTAGNDALIGSLREELSNLVKENSQLRAMQLELQDQLRFGEDRYNRKLEDAQWDAVESEKKIAEVKGQLDAAKDKIEVLEQRLESKEEERKDSERLLRAHARDLEDRLHKETQQLAQLRSESARQVAELQNQLQKARDLEAKRAELEGEAEQASQRTSLALDNQRSYFEGQIATLEDRIKEGEGHKLLLEEIVQEAREDARTREDLVEDLRKEVQAQQERLIDLEAQVELQQRVINKREDDLLQRERERQQSREVLAKEEDRASRLQKQVRDLENALADIQNEWRRKNSEMDMLVQDKKRLLEENTFQQEELQEHVRVIAAKDKELKDLGDKFKEHSAQSALYIKNREDQGAKIRFYENRIRELEAAQHNLQVQKETEIFQAAASSNTQRYGYGRGPLWAENARSDASRVLSRLTWNQWKTVLVACLVFLVLLGLYHSFAQQPDRISDTAELHNVQEKYSQTMSALNGCREQLAASRGGAGVTNAATPGVSALTSSPR